MVEQALKTDTDNPLLHLCAFFERALRGEKDKALKLWKSEYQDSLNLQHPLAAAIRRAFVPRRPSPVDRSVHGAPAGQRDRFYIMIPSRCLSFVMYFSKKCFWMSFISSSRPWI